MRITYTGFIASLVTRFLPAPGRDVAVDQHQANGCFGVHQLRCKLSGDPTTYRIIIAPADAPIFVGKVPADQHFVEPI